MANAYSLTECAAATPPGQSSKLVKATAKVGIGFVLRPNRGYSNRGEGLRFNQLRADFALAEEVAAERICPAAEFFQGERYGHKLGYGVPPGLAGTATGRPLTTAQRLATQTASGSGGNQPGGQPRAALPCGSAGMRS